MNDSQTESLRALSWKYFDGEASPEEEKLLFEMIADNEDAMACFRRSEKEWEKQHSLKREEEIALATLMISIRKKEERKHRRHIFRKALLWTAGAAAAVVAIFLCLGGVAGIGFLLSPADEYIVEVPLGQRSSITLPDGTNVWLNAGSTLKYSDRFNLFNRTVKLEGEGYFNVAKSDGLRHFTVKTKDYDVEVTGTQFNVSSYPEDSYSSVVLSEGRVEIKDQDKIIELQPGEAVTYDRSNYKYRKYVTDPEVAHSWTENIVEFKGITLKELITKLSRKYDMDIHLNAASVADRRFHISLRNNESIESVLEAISDIVPIEYEIDDNGIYINESFRK